MQKILLIGGAAIALALVVAWIMDSSNTPPPVEQPTQVAGGAAGAGAAGTQAPEVLFKSYFQPFPIEDKFLAGPLAATAWGSAGLKYRSGDYQEAIAEFKLVRDKKEMPAELVNFYMGVAQLALADGSAAVVTLQEVIDEKGSLSTQARWFLALARLQMKHPGKAKEQLQRLVDEKTYLEEPAKKVLQQIAGDT